MKNKHVLHLPNLIFPDPYSIANPGWCILDAYQTNRSLPVVILTERLMPDGIPDYGESIGRPETYMLWLSTAPVSAAFAAREACLQTLKQPPAALYIFNPAPPVSRHDEQQSDAYYDRLNLIWQGTHFVIKDTLWTYVPLNTFRHETGLDLAVNNQAKGN